MSCWLRSHEWDWPRKRGGIDTQVCRKCGASRVSKVQFGAKAGVPGLKPGAAQGDLGSVRSATP